MRKLLTGVLLLCSILTILYAQTPAQVGPYVQLNSPLPNLMLVVNEEEKIDLENYVSGYNLTFSQPSPLSGVKLIQRLNSLKNSDTSLIYDKHIYTTDENGGVKHIFLSTETGFVTVASQSVDSDVPTNLFSKQYSNDYQCFDLAFGLTGYMVLDCIQLSNMTNIFLVLSHTDSTEDWVLIPNPKYILSKNPNRTLKCLKVNENHIYILRFLHDDTEVLANNSFIEVFRMNSITSIAYIRVIDRTTFSLQALNITGAAVLESDVFLTTYENSIIRFNYTGDVVNFKIFATIVSQTLIAPQKDSVGINDRLVLATTDSQNAYEIDWTDWENPIFIAKYAFPNELKAYSIDVSDKFLIIATVNTSIKNISVLWIYNREKKLLSEIHSSIIFPTAPQRPSFYLNRLSNILLSVEAKSYKTYQIAYSLIILNSPNPAKNQSILLTCLSTDTLSNTTSLSNFTFNISTFAGNDYNVYNMIGVNNKSYCDFPGVATINLLPYFTGPALKYDILFLNSTSSSRKRSEQARGDFLEMRKETILTAEHTSEKANETNQTNNSLPWNISKLEQYKDLDLGFLKRFSGIHLINTIPLRTDPTGFNIIAQYKDSWMLSMPCKFVSDSNGSSKATCFTLFNYTTNPMDIILNQSFFYYNDQPIMAIKYQNNPYAVYLISVTTLEDLCFFSFSEFIFENEIFDFYISNDGSELIITNTLAKRIVGFDLAINVNKGRCKMTQKFIIYKNNITNQDYYSPRKVIRSHYHPSLLFIQSQVSIFVVSQSSDNSSVTLLTEIANTATRQLNGNYEIIVNSRSLIILANNPSMIEEYSLENYNSITLKRSIPLFGNDISVMQNSFIASEKTGFTYISGSDMSGRKSCLIYSTNAEGLNVLYDIIPTGQIQLESLFFSLIPNREFDMILIGSISDFNIYSVSPEPKLVFNLNSSNASFQFSIVASSKLSPSSPAYFNYNLTVIDSGSEIKRIEKPSIDIQSQPYQDLGHNQKAKSFDPHQIFIGSILDYAINCDACNKTIILQKPLSLSQKSIFRSKDFRSLASLGDYLFALYRDRLYVLQANGDFNSNMSIVNFVDFPIDDEASCELSSIHETGMVSATFCRDSAQIGYIFLASHVSSSPFVVLQKEVSVGTKVNKIFFKGEFLYILSENPEVISSASQLFIYRFDILSNDILTFGDIFDNVDFGLSDLNITNFEVFENDDGDSLNIFFCEAQNGLHIFSLDKSTFLTKKHYYLDTISLISDDGINKDKIQFLSMAVDSVPLTSPGSKGYTILLSMLNFHSYEFYAEFDLSSNLLKSFNKTKRFTRYNEFKSFGSIKTVGGVDNGLLIQGFFSPALYLGDIDKKFLVVYSRGNWNPNISTEVNVKGSLMLSGNSSDQNIELALSNVRKNKLGTSFSMLLLEKDLGDVSSYDVNNNISIIFTTDAYSNGKITLSATNLISTLKTEIELGSVGNDDEAANNILWIIFFVVGIILVIILIIYAIKKIRSKRHVRDSEEGLLHNKSERHSN